VIGLKLHQPLGVQAAQRFADGGATDSRRARQILFGQTGAGIVFAVQNAVADGGIGAFGGAHQAILHATASCGSSAPYALAIFARNVIDVDSSALPVPIQDHPARLALSNFKDHTF
jgi:hypothetical protein